MFVVRRQFESGMRFRKSALQRIRNYEDSDEGYAAFYGMRYLGAAQGGIGIRIRFVWGEVEMINGIHRD